jgi:RES domain-containing protein
VITWTRDAVASSASRRSAELWRGVEAQHVVSSMRLVDSLEEQRVLETLIDHAKPANPASLAGMHYLLAAPFRYRPRPPGSRFRGPDDPGVFYGAEKIRTACAEIGWWRWRGFLMDAPALRELGPVTFTLFPARARGSTVDLRRPPLDADHATWTDPERYAGTQALARVAREAGIAMLIYESVRDPEKGANIAVLRPEALAGLDEQRQQTWQLIVNATHAHWRRSGDEGFSFAQIHAS